jgi:trans-aconitate 2-methyltransferase
MWDAEQYLKYETERARPFFDLVAAVDHPHPRAVADLGSGPGGLTATLLARWPEAVIWGVDSSEEMINHARRLAVIERLRFELADVAEWQAPGPLDVIVSNACFQWIPDHAALLDHLASQIVGGGVLAFQVPNNFDEPSHVAIRELLSEPEWSELIREVRRPSVESPEWYVERLSDRAFSVNAWEVIYYHQLEGDDPVVEWLAGTTLRPILAVLPDDARERFLAAVSARLAATYPRRICGTIFPFRRVFVVAKAPRQRS